MARKQSAEPTFPLPPAMRIGLPNRPAVNNSEHLEPKFVDFAFHIFPLNNDAEGIRDFGGEIDVIAQIRFRFFAVALPQFREGFAIAVFRADSKMLGD